MHKSVLPFICGLLTAFAAGCEHMVESRVVHAFAESISRHDLTLMKAEASRDFEDKAVKGDDTFRALKLIELPDGMPKVTRVKDVREENGTEVIEKRVWATVGKERRKLVFRLKPDGGSGRWVVDDLFLSKDDFENNRSVATRLAVLLSLQESLDAWKSGDRGRILAAATPEFAESLSGLAAAQLAQFARKVTADMADTTQIRSDERIGDETSELAVAKAEADLLMTFRREGKRWRLDDLSVKSRRPGEDLASARLVSAAMAAALKFETAFRNSDKRALSEVCTPQFFNGSLAEADLATVHLPDSGPALEGFDIKLDEKKATFVVPAGNEWLKISLDRQPDERLHAASKFLVEEVTIYDQSQDKRLSALFTARTTMEAFSAALARRDLETLKKYSTHDLNTRVWDAASPALAGGLPMIGFAAARPTVRQMRFEGSLTEILVDQGETPVTYRLRDEGGRILVDDLLAPVADCPESFKESAEVVLPILSFGLALRRSDMETVRGAASVDFSRFAWNHFQRAPQFDVDPLGYFQAPLARINRNQQRATVVFGDERHGALFTMVKERGAFHVDDVTLVAGPDEEQHIPLKRTIRAQLAQGDSQASRASVAGDAAARGAEAGLETR